MTPPYFVDADGAEYPLGPLMVSLVRALLGVTAKMRRCPSYRVELHVKHASVVVHVQEHLGTFTYGTPLEQQETA